MRPAHLHMSHHDRVLMMGHATITTDLISFIGTLGTISTGIGQSSNRMLEQALIPRSIEDMSVPIVCIARDAPSPIQSRCYALITCKA